jgi:hypothetical protein
LIIKSLLSNRIFKIKINNNILSKYYNLVKGITQGSSLGPLLFSLFINDIGLGLDILYLLFADDLIIYYASDNPTDLFEIMQKNLNIISEWSNVNDLTISIEKTKYMYFFKPKSNIVLPINDYVISGQVIGRVKSFKYLGLVYEENLHFNLQFNSVTDRISKCVSVLNKYKRFMPKRIMLIYFNALILPTIDFCSNIWACQTDVMYQAIQKKLDNFLLSYFYPSLFKKSCKNYKRKRLQSNQKPCVLDILNSCNTLTVSERINLNLFKYVLKIIYYGSDCQDLDVWFNPLYNNKFSRNLPLLPVINHKSQLYKKSIRYRCGLLWNSLPKNWDWDFVKLSYDFIILRYNGYLISKRSNTPFYYH